MSCIRLPSLRQTVDMKEVRNNMFSEKLNNGMRVVGEIMPGYRSVSMGVWINAGSVYEQGDEIGAAHFIEHMLFKGTAKHSSSEIAEIMDAVGGNLNAFTGKECTCFYGRVLERSLDVISDILADIIGNSLLAPEEIKKEKGVVCEEIAMNEDTPEDIVLETAMAGFYEGDPLERPILGSRESVRSFTHDGLVKYMDRLYKPDNMVISVAGNFNDKELMKILNNSFTAIGSADRNDVEFGIHKPGKRVKFVKKDIEQTHICMCLPGFKKDTKESYAQLLFTNAMGGSMSSRLFRRIREESGLAYSVYAYPTAYGNSGLITLYAGTSAENSLTVMEMMLDEIKTTGREGITKAELARAKNQIISSFLMAQESTAARSSSIGRTELLHGRHYSEDEIIGKIEAVTMDDIEAILPTICGLDDFSAACAGRCDAVEDDMRRLLLSKR